LDGRRVNFVAAKSNATTSTRLVTQVIPVTSCTDRPQVLELMRLCGIPRALTYGKLGSLNGWKLDWRKADTLVREVMKPSEIGLPAKIWEWTVNDAMKAINAQQEAATTFIVRDIYRKFKEKADRDRLVKLLKTDPTADNWLHRVFRNRYIKGRTCVKNQVVYQGCGYTCKRITRNTVLLSVAGLVSGKRIGLKLKCRHIITGQIRVILNDIGELEIHCVRKLENPMPHVSGEMPVLGLDKGYTEAYFTSNGDEIGKGLGELLTAKTKRITQTNRNRYRLRCHAENIREYEPEKTARILSQNLGYKVKSRRLKREKATIKNLIRRDLRRIVTVPTKLVAEDLTQPIRGKRQAKAINRKLNQWMKGELQESLEMISKETGSTLSVVNPAYTSQVDNLTGTLLGSRQGDRFIRYTGDVVQADENAAKNIRDRSCDGEIHRYQKSHEVRKILQIRTIRYLFSIGSNVSDSVSRGWLKVKPQYIKEMLAIEKELAASGVEATVNR
jgi:IS605 OrfB family transposase